MTPLVALLDANVIYPASLRDLLPQVAFAGLCQARWSAEIEDEWMRNLRAARRELAERIRRTHLAMRRAFPDAMVTPHADQIASLVLPDPGDRHVLAAAIACGAGIIVTSNVRDFPSAALAAHGVVARHPDIFYKG